MRIGDAAAAAGLTPRALRYYEQCGLISARRTPSGHREYGPGELRRVRAVRDLLETGLTIGDVRAFVHLLDTMPVGGSLPGQWRADGKGPCATAEAVIRRRLADLDERIRDLTELRDRLAERVGEPPAGQGNGRRGAATSTARQRRSAVRHPGRQAVMGATGAGRAQGSAGAGAQTGAGP